MATKKDSIVSDFFNFVDVHGYAPEPWCIDEILSPGEWILEGGWGDCGEPEWFDDLENVKRGAKNSIDNCTGEFRNYHEALAAFISKKTGKEIRLVFNKWMDESDRNYKDSQVIVYECNGKEYKITRKESVAARGTSDDLAAFLEKMVKFFSSSGACGR